MDRKFTKRTGSWQAVSPHGDEITICEYTDFREIRDLQGSRTIELPLKTLKTSDGLHVNRLDKGKYQVLGTWPFEATSDDPDAP